MAADAYTRTVTVPTLEATASKAGRVKRAMKHYRHARELTLEYFREHGTDGFGYDDREALRKRISAHDRVDLPARTIYPAITTTQQNYEQYERGEFDGEPQAHRADTLALEGQNSYLFHNEDRYYLNVATGAGAVNLPLRVADDDPYHADRMPHPHAVPDDGHRRPGVAFAALEAEAFPGNTVSLGTSTLHREGTRNYRAHLTFQHVPQPAADADATPRYVVGVDRGRNALATAAVLDRRDGQVVDWFQRSGDALEHRMNQYAERIREFQAASAWADMGRARQRRRRYTEQVDYEVANAVVALAREHAPATIALEELSDMGRLGNYAPENRRFSEWSYYRLEECIADKAAEYAIDVAAVDPAHTSATCSRCGSEDTHRDGVHFRCRACGYDQHADRNAAVNIAQRGAETLSTIGDAASSEVTA
jgi:IS605 OrfB family transposase